MDKDLYIEKIEAYLLDKLSSEDKAGFEALIDTDPILKSELQFQKEIIEAIRERRKNELKKRLDNITVESFSFYELSRTLWISLTLLSVSVLLIFTAIKVFDRVPTSQSKTALSQESTSKTQAPELSQVSPVPPEEKMENQEEKELESVSPAYSSPQSQMTMAIPAKSVESPKERIPAAQPARDKVYNAPLATRQPLDLNQEVDDRTLIDSKVSNIYSAQKDNSSATSAAGSEDDVKGIFDGTNEANLEEIAERNKLNYQYYNNKLFLYPRGAHGKSIKLYNKGLERTFLYYESNYYELKESQVDTQQATPIRDETLIQELDKIRLEKYKD